MWPTLESCGRGTGGAPKKEEASARAAPYASEAPVPPERERVIALGEVSPPRMAVLTPGVGPARAGVLMLGGSTAGSGAAVASALVRRGHTVLRLPPGDGDRAFEALWRLHAVESVEPQKSAVLGGCAGEWGTALDVAAVAPETVAALILLREVGADGGEADGGGGEGGDSKPRAWVEERATDVAALSCPVLIVLLAGGDEEAARMRDQLGALASALDRAGSRDYTVKLVALDRAAEPGSDPAPPADFIGQWLRMRLSAAPPGSSAE